MLASRHLAEDVSKLPKFLSVLSASGQTQQFVVPNGVQVTFVLGLISRQNKSAFVRSVTPQHTSISILFSSFACGPKDHASFVAEGDGGVDARRPAGGDEARSHGYDNEKSRCGEETRRIKDANPEQQAVHAMTQRRRDG